MAAAVKTALLPSVRAQAMRLLELGMHEVAKEITEPLQMLAREPEQASGTSRGRRAHASRLRIGRDAPMGNNAMVTARRWPAARAPYGLPLAPKSPSAPCSTPRNRTR